MKKLMPTLLLLISLPACGHKADGQLSSPKSIVGSADFTVLTAAAVAADAAAAAMGSLMVVMPDPETSGATFALPFCTGIQISARHVLTAAHCDRTQYIFNTRRLAQDADVNNYSFEPSGVTVRMVYHGEFIPASAIAETQAPDYKVVFKDQALDFVILQFAYDLAGRPLAMDNVSQDASDLTLYGYPNGMPLTQARQCHGKIDDDGRHLRHDCDSLSGASGGLITDRSGKPLAIQLTGPALNRADYHEQTGTFESAEDFALQRGCVREQADFAKCVWARGMNGGLLFSEIRRVLQDKAPDVWAAVSRVD